MRQRAPRSVGPQWMQSQPAAHVSLLESLARQLLFRDPTGELVGRSSDIEQLAEHAAERMLDAAATWVEQVGPFYDGDAVRSLLSRGDAPVSRQAVHKRRGVLALTTGSGQVVYPAAQFQGRRPAPALGPVLDALPADLVSRWTVASWLFSPNKELDGERPIDLLHDGGPEGAAAVLGAARRWAVQLGAAA
jgi:hypothetical protein